MIDLNYFYRTLDKTKQEYSETEGNDYPLFFACKNNDRDVRVGRKTYGDQIISASEVRKKYAENQLKSVCGMLPESTWRYLERKKNENGK